MLKLLKYEMIHSYRSFAIVFAVFLIGCLVFPLLPLEMFAIGSVMLVFATMGISIAVFVTIVRNYNNSMFKKPGYLTLTLPVSSHEIVISKIISALIWLFVTGLILFVGFALMVLVAGGKFGANVSMGDIIEALNYAFKYLDYAEFFKAMASGFIATVSSIIGLFALMTVVQTKYTRKRKTFMAFIIFFAYAFLFGTVVQEWIFNYEANDILFNLPTLFNLIEIAIFYVVTIYVLDYKLEIE